MKVPRRTFLGAAAAGTVFAAISYARGQPAKVGGISKPTSRERLEDALNRIGDPKGEGARACLTVYSQAARDAADAADARSRSNISLGPLDGAIVTVKDLFDVAGEALEPGRRCCGMLRRRFRMLQWFAGFVLLER